MEEWEEAWERAETAAAKPSQCHDAVSQCNDVESTAAKEPEPVSAITVPEPSHSPHPSEGGGRMNLLCNRDCNI